MIEAIKEHLSNPDNQLIIKGIQERYQLSPLEYISLIDILMYYYSISPNPNTVEIIPIICDKIITYREKFKVNQTGEFFTVCIKEFVNRECSKNYDATIDNLKRLAEEGLVFHSFNSAFFDKINEQGLIIQEKPWDLEELETVRKIFQKKNNNNIFGLYQGRTSTPIFFTDTLISSPYYGLSSPTFFRKFVEHKSEYRNTFLNRDLESAKKSMEDLCNGLEPYDARTTMHFFNKYWNLFTNGALPCVAISTVNKLNIKTYQMAPFENESQEDYYIRVLLHGHVHIISNNIPRESLELFSYESLSFNNPVKEKNI